MPVFQFALLDIPLGITSSSIGFLRIQQSLKICTIATGIKKCKSVIRKKKKKHDKMVLLAKSKSNSIEVLISTAIINSNISHDE